MAYLDHYLDKRNERLQRKHKAPARVIRGDRRERVVGEVMDVLKDWRLSHFENEAPCRYGLRAALCLDGHSWPTADVEADLVVQEALSLIGAERPSWAEGQWAYTVPRENCAWCSIAIDADGQANGDRFCSVMCATSSFESRVYKEGALVDGLMRRARGMIRREKAPTLCCTYCDRKFKKERAIFDSYRSSVRFCSNACADASRRTLVEIECNWCNERFRPDGKRRKYCSADCSRQGIIRDMRAALPERHCCRCKAVFRPKNGLAMYCSRACARVIYSANYYQKKKAAQPSNVIYLTAEIFDGWFKRAA
ncbi:hypothetical protein [Rhizobium sp. Root483D2]|uniref:hypothetical protein n=1 Tax=Rhizobium sp. Root483D2 TaxID=1736545 RepID=UPI0007151D43|nr:hypothetical protein [Rhizobium sp. Root483D2]KQY21030.1 hypothetical protein ASD32_06525 [Rhizobium sp. Root483D2]